MSYDSWKATDPRDAEYREPPLRLVTCPQCGGDGYRVIADSSWNDPYGVIEKDCEVCGGSGAVLEDDDGQPDEAQEWHDFDEDC